MSYDMTNHEKLELKPDYQDTVRRYEAFWNRDIIDRPIVRVHVPNKDYDMPSVKDNYYERIHTDIDQIVSGIRSNANSMVYLGEALPQPSLSFGCDEMAAICGGDLYFLGDNHDTCWATHFVDDWETVFPIKIKEDHPLWLRRLELLEKCAEAFCGKMLFAPIDLVSNMDMLAGMRGSQGLCTDLIDCPHLIDKALEQVMDVFASVCEHAFKKYNLPGPNGVDHLQCDFSYMISTEMFQRTALPCLEQEADFFDGRVFYHWDGPGALKHTDALIASKLHVFGYVPGAGNGGHRDYLDIYQKLQNAGKAVWVGGDAEDVKFLHKHLKPHLTIYDTYLDTKEEAEELLEWFVKNT